LRDDNTIANVPLVELENFGTGLDFAALHDFIQPSYLNDPVEPLMEPYGSHSLSGCLDLFPDTTENQQEEQFETFLSGVQEDIQEHELFHTLTHDASGVNLDDIDLFPYIQVSQGHSNLDIMQQVPAENTLPPLTASVAADWQPDADTPCYLNESSNTDALLFGNMNISMSDFEPFGNTSMLGTALPYPGTGSHAGFPQEVMLEAGAASDEGSSFSQALNTTMVPFLDNTRTQESAHGSNVEVRNTFIFSG
jgi:hypothetical protein